MDPNMPAHEVQELRRAMKLSLGQTHSGQGSASVGAVSAQPQAPQALLQPLQGQFDSYVMPLSTVRPGTVLGGSSDDVSIVPKGNGYKLVFPPHRDPKNFMFQLPAGMTIDIEGRLLHNSTSRTQRMSVAQVLQLPEGATMLQDAAESGYDLYDDS